MVDKKTINNTYIATLFLGILVFVLIGAYINQSQKYENIYQEYSTLNSTLEIQDPNKISKKIEEYIYNNITNKTTNISITYLGVFNSMYRYNITINQSWDYVYSTLNGKILFVPLTIGEEIYFKVYLLN